MGTSVGHRSVVVDMLVLSVTVGPLQAVMVRVQSGCFS